MEKNIEHYEKERVIYQNRTVELHKKRKEFIESCFFGRNSATLNWLCSLHLIDDRNECFTDEFTSFFEQFYNLKRSKKRFRRYYHREVTILKSIWLQHKDRWGSAMIFSEICWKGKYARKLYELDYNSWIEIKQVLFKIKKCLSKFLEKYGNTDEKNEFQRLAGCNLKNKKSIECFTICESCGHENDLEANFCSQCGEAIR